MACVRMGVVLITVWDPLKYTLHAWHTEWPPNIVTSEHILLYMAPCLDLPYNMGAQTKHTCSITFYYWSSNMNDPFCYDIPPHGKESINI